MAELRTEAGLLLDVLIERLGALKTAAVAETSGATATSPDAEPTAEPTAPDADPTAADAEPDVEPTAAEPAAGDASTAAADAAGEPATDPAPEADGLCPTCGHDPSRMSCTGCPVCALLAVLRGERPELTAKLLDGALSAMTAMRALLGEPASDERSATDHRSAQGEGGQPEPPPEPPAPRAQRIDIR